jgi:L-alanine-DL-glutamate epimerase-like enolase superfamily enzyme
MKITKVEVIPLQLKLRHSYAVAYGRYASAEMVLLRVDAGRWTGWGCAAPDEHVTGETQSSASRALRRVAHQVLLGADATGIARLNHQVRDAVRTQLSARAAVSIALYDLLGKRAGLPVYQLFGRYRSRIATSATIGICGLAQTRREAGKLVEQGFRVLKLKGGGDWELDAARVLDLRRRYGRRIKLRFDANQGYTIDDAVRFLDRVGGRRSLDILEQPTQARYRLALKEVTARSSVPVMADEAILTFRDSFLIAHQDLADMINIKLMKVGGIEGALKANAVAEAAGLEAMIGCMDESQISIAAGLALALAQRNIEFADLDGHLDLIGDPGANGVTLRNGYLYPSPRPGFGVEVRL